MMPENGQLPVPPGFRFHPTDEELLYYYLRKKVSYEAIDLDVVREVDLNKLEPWDLKEKCRIGSGPQNEWYFFSHKDKKYPTGTRTNRATIAGFWKATGRDKAIHLNNSKRIGMRKTLVFYTGRAPHGQKTDWIMHEYRLDDDNTQVQVLSFLPPLFSLILDSTLITLCLSLSFSYSLFKLQEDGWVVCRVFRKKGHNNRGFQPEIVEEDDQHHFAHMKSSASGSPPLDLKQNLQALYDQCNFDGSMHLPPLLSPESATHPSFLSPMSFNTTDIECSHSLLRLTSGGCGVMQQERFNGDWSFLDKLLASHQNLDQSKCHHPPSQALDHVGLSAQRFPFQYLGCETDILKFFK
ncbi:hypothetical protein HYC85_014987 [Camellia sinensis]|uniref:NAC domain-containing protein n=1 Tax=Camellia sinensis TaxID=4442 RepID=A0A7J7H7X6_CAMSI|nr:hypothetical protein HYC85_014987 [Camellia sinensis]